MCFCKVIAQRKIYEDGFVVHRDPQKDKSIGNVCWRSIVAAVSRFSTVTICLVFLFSGPLGLAGTPWCQFRGTSAHNGLWDGDLNPGEVVLKWSYDPSVKSEENGDVRIDSFDSQSQPCLSDDGARVFAVGYSKNDSNGQIIAIDTVSGEMLWTLAVHAFVDMGSFSSPIFHEGYVYWIGSKSSEAIHIYKINARNGSCETDTGGWLKVIEGASLVNMSPMVAQGRLFFSSYADFGVYNAVHYALDIADGSILWRNSVSGGSGTATWSYDEERSIAYQPTFIGGKHNVSAFDPNTGIILKTSFSTDNSLFAIATNCYEGKVYFQDYDFFGKGKVYAASMDDLSNALLKSACPGSGDSCPVATPNAVYTCGDYTGSGQTRACDKQGSVLWTFTEAGGWTRCPAYASGYLMIGSQDSNKLYIVDPAKIPVDSRFIVDTVAGSGSVAFGVDDFYSISVSGILYCYQSVAREAILTINSTDTLEGTVIPDGAMNVLAYHETAIRAIPKARFVFDQWISSGAGRIEQPYSENTTAISYGDLSVKARFTPSTTVYKLTMTILSDAGGATEPEAGMITPVAAGMAMTIKAIPLSGGEFAKWDIVDGSAYIEDKTQAETTIVLKSDVTLRALFEGNTATLHSTSDYEGKGVVEPSGLRVMLVDVSYPISATPAEGYYFVQWAYEPESSQLTNRYAAKTTIKISEDSTLTAVFAKSVTVATDAKKPKAKIKIDTKKPIKDRITLKNFPLSEALTIVNQNVSVFIDGYRFDDLELERSKNQTYHYKNKADPRIAMTLDVFRHTWSFDVTGSEDGFLNVDNSDGVTIVLMVGDDQQFGANYTMTETTAWTFDERKAEDFSTKLEVFGEEMDEFAISKATFKLDAAINGEKYETIDIRSGSCVFPSGFEFAPKTDAVAVVIGDHKYDLMTGDRVWNAKKGSRFVYRDNESNVDMKLNMENETWKFRSRKEEVSTFIEYLSNEIDVYLAVGDISAGVRLRGERRTQLTF